MKFKDRRDAGQQLADRLSEYREEPGLLVIGLPRGGVPVALEIATALRGELDVMLVRKIGLPWHPELAAGAVASGGTQIFNEDVIEGSGVTDSQLQPVIDRELKELNAVSTCFVATGNQWTPLVAMLLSLMMALPPGQP
jgi:putative phosphoribosyl transferase